MTDQAQAPTTEDGQLHQRSRNYGKVPHAIMHDLKLTDGAVRLYAHMHWRYGSNHQNFEGRASMAKMLGVSDRTIGNRIRELESAGWVVVIERDFDEKSGKYRTPFYHVFETRKAARQFRAEYKTADGEQIRQRPKLTDDAMRKSRAGKGGKPSHKAEPETIGTQVPQVVTGETIGTQVPQYVGTQVPTIQEQVYPRTKREELPAPVPALKVLPKPERKYHRAWVQHGEKYADGKIIDVTAPDFEAACNDIFYAWLDGLDRAGVKPDTDPDELWATFRVHAVSLAKNRRSADQITDYVDWVYSSKNPDKFYREPLKVIRLAAISNSIGAWLTQQEKVKAASAPKPALAPSAPVVELTPDEIDQRRREAEAVREQMRRGA